MHRDVPNRTNTAPTDDLTAAEVASEIRRNLNAIQKSVTKSRQLLARVERGEISESTALLLINSNCLDFLFRGDEVSRRASERHNIIDTIEIENVRFLGA